MYLNPPLGALFVGGRGVLYGKTRNPLPEVGQHLAEYQAVADSIREEPLSEWEWTVGPRCGRKAAWPNGQSAGPGSAARDGINRVLTPRRPDWGPRSRDRLVAVAVVAPLPFPLYPLKTCPSSASAIVQKITNKISDMPKKPPTCILYGDQFFWKNAHQNSSPHLRSFTHVLKLTKFMCILTLERRNFNGKTRKQPGNQKTTRKPENNQETRKQPGNQKTTTIRVKIIRILKFVARFQLGLAKLLKSHLIQ